MKDKEKTIYLSNVESSALVIQSMLVGARMELLDLLDYARNNGIDSVPVRHIQEEVIGLRELEEEEYNHREKCYLEAHENNPWKSCKEELPKEGQKVLICVNSNSRSTATINPRTYHFEISERLSSVELGRLKRKGWCPYDKYGFPNHGYDTFEVVYWMPIPELPKGGEE